MPALQRITTEFVETEDRMRLSGENDAGEIISFWLTQRLLIRLITHLVASLEEIAPDIKAQQLHDQRISEMLQEMEQQSAQAQMAEQSPVRDPNIHRTWLALEVDVKKAEPQILLSFRGKESAGADLALEDQHLRQWLAILHRLWNQAQWPSTIWPKWITDVAPEKEINLDSALH